jgi:hypothetical protein
MPVCLLHIPVPQVCPQLVLMWCVLGSVSAPALTAKSGVDVCIRGQGVLDTYPAG